VTSKECNIEKQLEWPRPQNWEEHFYTHIGQTNRKNTNAFGRESGNETSNGSVHEFVLLCWLSRGVSVCIPMTKCWNRNIEAIGLFAKLNSLQGTKISQHGKRKTIDSKAPAGRGYVGFQEGNSSLFVEATHFILFHMSCCESVTKARRTLAPPHYDGVGGGWDLWGCRLFL